MVVSTAMMVDKYAQFVAISALCTVRYLRFKRKRWLRVPHRGFTSEHGTCWSMRLGFPCRDYPRSHRRHHRIPPYLEYGPSADRRALARRTVRDVQRRDPGGCDSGGDRHLLEAAALLDRG